MLLKCILISLSTVVACSAFAWDKCQTFYWSTNYVEAFSSENPYRISFVKGEIPEDSVLNTVEGSYIRERWSSQAFECVLSKLDYGVFSHDAFIRKSFPNQINDVFTAYDYALGGDSNNQAFDSRLKILAQNIKSEYLLPKKLPLESFTNNTVLLCTSLTRFVDELDVVLDTNIDFSVRQIILGEFCANATAEKLAKLEETCEEFLDERCDLLDLYDSISRCEDTSNPEKYANGLKLYRDVMAESRNLCVSKKETAQALLLRMSELEG